MPRDIPVGNGNLLVAFDKDYLIREFYFPHIGQENHVTTEPFRFGVWADGVFSWVPDGWKITRDYLDDSLVTRVELVSERLKLRITANDLVDFHENVYLRRLVVENLSATKRDVRLFFCHDFHIYGNDIGDTAAYRPEVKGLVHYKDRRYFLINLQGQALFSHKPVREQHGRGGGLRHREHEGRHPYRHLEGRRGWGVE
jgi:GH15 family glucan-1,4-alpha-glucosidase